MFHLCFLTLGCNVISFFFLHAGQRSDTELPGSVWKFAFLRNNLLSLYTSMLLRFRFQYVNFHHGCDHPLRSKRGFVLRVHVMSVSSTIYSLAYLRNVLQWHFVLGISTYSRMANFILICTATSPTQLDRKLKSNVIICKQSLVCSAAFPETPAKQSGSLTPSHPTWSI